MMGLSFSHLLLLLLVVLLLFGRGRISGVMGEIGRGVRSLREGLKGENEPKDTTPALHVSSDESKRS